MLTVKDIRNQFSRLYHKGLFNTDRNGGKVIEILGASFIVDEDSIFGTPNQDYIDAELKWYLSQDNNVNTLAKFYGKLPIAWKYSASPDGEINSNYGTLVFSEKYNNQFNNALQELINNPDSRRASMIYNRPSIWNEYNENGKSDFICTNSQTVYIRDNKLNMVCQMRSNDAWAGFRNDVPWAKYLMNEFVNQYNNTTGGTIEIGKLIWQVQNLHIYERNFNYIKEYILEGIKND